MAFEITLASRRVNHRTYQGLGITCNTNQQYMSIGTSWKEGANVRMQVNCSNGRESLPKVLIWDGSSLES